MANEPISQQVTQIADFVAAEADSVRKTIRLQIVITAVIAVVLIVYFAVMNSMLKQATEPKELARFTAHVMEENAPSFGDFLSTMLKDGAPQLANFVVDQASKEGVPFLTRHTKTLLNKHTDKLSDETAVFMEQAFNEVVVGNKAQFIELLKNNQNPNDVSYAVRPMRDALREAFVRQTTSRKTDAGRAVEASLNMLKNLNLRLKALAGKPLDELSRKEQLASRLLKMHWMWMRTRTGDDVGNEPKPGAVDPADE
jgi:hypothetical protein